MARYNSDLMWRVLDNKLIIYFSLLKCQICCIDYVLVKYWSEILMVGAIFELKVMFDCEVKGGVNFLFHT